MLPQYIELLYKLILYLENKFYYQLEDFMSHTEYPESLKDR